jgi:hypothetical protein
VSLLAGDVTMCAASLTRADIGDHLGRGMALCVPTTSMAEGERFDTLFQ